MAKPAEPVNSQDERRICAAAEGPGQPLRAQGYGAAAGELPLRCAVGPVRQGGLCSGGLPDKICGVKKRRDMLQSA